MIFQNSKLSSVLNSTVTALNYTLANRNDVIVTTSFGYQSALLFFLLDEAGVNAKYLYISSKLSYGNIPAHRNRIKDLFDIQIDEINRDDWLENETNGIEFIQLSDVKKADICRDLKRTPLLEYSKKYNRNIWVTGIRRDQSSSRALTQFVNGTDLGMVKIAPMYNWVSSDAYELMKYCKLPINEDYKDLCKMNNKKECGLHL